MYPVYCKSFCSLKDVGIVPTGKISKDFCVLDSIPQDDEVL